MLTITVPGVESFDEEKNEFLTPEDVTLELEHSLFSISKWESKWHLPFLATPDKTTEQTLDYVRMMVLTPDFDPTVFSRLTNENMDAVNDYIADPMTATTIRELPGQSRGSSEIITAEIVYYWMVSMNIPFECQHWHFNRLIMLVRVCNQKNQPAKKMSRREAAQQQRMLNRQRQAQYGTAG